MQGDRRIPPGAGPGHLRRIVEAAGEVPVLAIGGIRLSSIPDVVRAGARGVAVCGGILGRRDPRRAAQAYALALRVALGPMRGVPPPVHDKR